MPPFARGLVSLIFWALSVPGLLMHLVMVRGVLYHLPGALHALPYTTLADWAEAGRSCLFAASILSWPILAWMTVGWILSRPIRPCWIWTGTILAVAWMLLDPRNFVYAAYVLSGILFATYLCLWHGFARVRDPFGDEKRAA